MTNYVFVLFTLVLCGSFASRVVDEEDHDEVFAKEAVITNANEGNDEEVIQQDDGEFVQEDDDEMLSKKELVKTNATEGNGDGFVDCGGITSETVTASNAVQVADDLVTSAEQEEQRAKAEAKTAEQEKEKEDADVITAQKALESAENEVTKMKKLLADLEVKANKAASKLKTESAEADSAKLAVEKKNKAVASATAEVSSKKLALESAKKNYNDLKTKRDTCGECAKRAGPGWVWSGGVCKPDCNKHGILCRNSSISSNHYTNSYPNHKAHLWMTKKGYVRILTGDGKHNNGKEKWEVGCGCSYCMSCTYRRGTIKFENNCELKLKKGSKSMTLAKRRKGSCDDNVYMVVQDDCNFVMYNEKEPIWDIGARC